MKCPYCSNQLRSVVSNSVVVNVCPACRGIWFGSEQFADFVRRLSQSEEIAPQAVELFRHREVKRSFEAAEKDRFCPQCGEKLKTFNYSYDSNIFLDKCPGCGGIWADKGEAIGIAAYIKDNPRATEVGKSITETLEQPDVSESARLGYFLFFPRLIIPLSDDVPHERFPFVTISLIIMCVLSFIATAIVAVEPKSFISEFGFVPAHFFGIGIITSMFLHGGIFHLVFNMFYLWLFGDNVEDRFTRIGYLFFYMLCGIFGAVLYSVFNWNSTVPLIGASGAVAGVMGAYIVFYPSANIKLFAFTGTIDVNVIVFLGLWFAGNLVSVLIPGAGDSSGIAYLAHVGGFVFGLIVASVKKMKSGCAAGTQ